MAPDTAADPIPRCKHGFAVAHNESVEGLSLCHPPVATAATTTTEWCVMHKAFPADEPHRGPWPEEKCRQWVGKDDGFYVARREVGPWTKA